MSEGGCFCGNVRYSVSGEPVTIALCHCLDCRKISGSTYSTNMVIKEDDFKVLSGNAKPISKIGGSGNTITSHFCGDCGSTMWRDGLGFPGRKIIKAGTLDDVDALAKAKPTVELYAPRRVDWVTEIPGAAQKQTIS